MLACTVTTNASLRVCIGQWARRFPYTTSNIARSCNGTSKSVTSASIRCRNLSTVPASPRAHLRKPNVNLSFQTIRHNVQVGAKEHRVLVALGSNMGDRVAMIEKACKEMEATGKIRLVRTSSLWETKAMYVEDQDNFVNGVCEVMTALSPIALLDELQNIERQMGRVKLIDKGPRNIDLDILLFDDIVHHDQRLQIPHPLMREREFVLRPLCELVPDRKLPPTFSEKYKHLLAKLPPSDPPLSPFIPLPRSLPPIKPRDPNRATRIMSILNVTPDSFSDGGNNYNIDNAALIATIRSHIAAGATIIDIGGQSTRPGAEQVTPKEELSRILPAISIIRSLPEAENIAISIDTYHASVARAAIEAGADIINDVSAGQLDPLMLSTVAELGCTICLMHMRGTPETMNTLTNYGPTGVVSRVSDELVQRVQAAQRAGIRRWRIILDPGIGFAKTQDQNITLIRQLRELRETPRLWGLPWLVGVSRKGFIGKITGVDEPEKRVGGTAAVVTASIAEGADIVRVHDVEVMAQVARMADALYRPDTLPVAKAAAGTGKNVKIKYVYKGAVKR